MAGPPPTDEARLRDFVHDVRNALASIIGIVDCMIDELGDGANVEQIRDDLVVLGAAANRIDDLLLAFSGFKRPNRAAQPLPPQREPAVGDRDRVGRILIIDDDALVAKTLQRALRDFEVDAVTDARTALARLAVGKQYDLIFCDLMMPGMTGAEFYLDLERAGSDHIARVVFITAGAKTDEMREFIASVPNVVLSKPFDVEALRALVRTRVRR